MSKITENTDTDDSSVVVRETRFQPVIQEQWYRKIWRPMTAFIYLIIVLFDFMLMPIYMNIIRPTGQEIADLGQNSDNPIAYFNTIQNYYTWQPLTLQQNGLLHLSFGGILGVTAWTRGREKEARTRNGEIMN